MSSDASAKIWDEAINKRLFELTHSPHSAEAFGGLIAIGARAPNCWRDLPCTKSF